MQRCLLLPARGASALCRQSLRRIPGSSPLSTLVTPTVSASSSLRLCSPSSLSLLLRRAASSAACPASSEAILLGPTPPSAGTAPAQPPAAKAAAAPQPQQQQQQPPAPWRPQPLPLAAAGAPASSGQQPPAASPSAPTAVTPSTAAAAPASSSPSSEEDAADAAARLVQRALSGASSAAVARSQLTSALGADDRSLDVRLVMAARILELEQQISKLQQRLEASSPEAALSGLMRRLKAVGRKQTEEDRQLLQAVKVMQLDLTARKQAEQDAIDGVTSAVSSAETRLEAISAAAEGIAQVEARIAECDGRIAASHRAMLQAQRMRRMDHPYHCRANRIDDDPLASEREPSGLRGWTVFIVFPLALIAVALVFGLEIHRFFRYIGAVDSDLTQRPTKTA